MILVIFKTFLGFNVVKNSQFTEETQFYKFTLLCLDKLRECKPVWGKNILNKECTRMINKRICFTALLYSVLSQIININFTLAFKVEV